MDLAKIISYGPIVKITEYSLTFFEKNSQNTFWLYIESVGLEEQKETIKIYFETFKLTPDRLIEIGEVEDVSPNIQ